MRRAGADHGGLVLDSRQGSCEYYNHVTDGMRRNEAAAGKLRPERGVAVQPGGCVKNMVPPDQGC